MTTTTIIITTTTTTESLSPVPSFSNPIDSGQGPLDHHHNSTQLLELLDDKENDIDEKDDDNGRVWLD